MVFSVKSGWKYGPSKNATERGRWACPLHPSERKKKKKREGLYGRTKIRKDPVGPYREARKI
jgi:hypothetical protein